MRNHQTARKKPEALRNKYRDRLARHQNKGGPLLESHSPDTHAPSIQTQTAPPRPEVGGAMILNRRHTCAHPASPRRPIRPWRSIGSPAAPGSPKARSHCILHTTEYWQDGRPASILPLQGAPSGMSPSEKLAPFGMPHKSAPKTGRSHKRRRYWLAQRRSDVILARSPGS